MEFLRDLMPNFYQNGVSSCMSNMDLSASEAAVSFEWYIVQSGVFVRPIHSMRILSWIPNLTYISKDWEKKVKAQKKC